MADGSCFVFVFLKQKDEQTHQSSCVLFPIKQKLRETPNRRKILFLSRKQYTQMREKVVSPIKGVKPNLFSLMPRLAKWMALLPNVKYNHPKTSHTRRHTTHLEIYFEKIYKINKRLSFPFAYSIIDICHEKAKIK